METTGLRRPQKSWSFRTTMRKWVRYWRGGEGGKRRRGIGKERKRVKQLEWGGEKVVRLINCNEYIFTLRSSLTCKAQRRKS